MVGHCDQNLGQGQPIHISIPSAAFMPWLSGWLDMPKHPCRRSVYATDPDPHERGLGTTGGCARPGSLRDSPCPGGQSGHPLSPDYRAGHDAWATDSQRRWSWIDPASADAPAGIALNSRRSLMPPDSSFNGSGRPDPTSTPIVQDLCGAVGAVKRWKPTAFPV